MEKLGTCFQIPELFLRRKWSRGGREGQPSTTSVSMLWKEEGLMLWTVRGTTEDSTWMKAARKE